MKPQGVVALLLLQFAMLGLLLLLNWRIVELRRQASLPAKPDIWDRVMLGWSLVALVAFNVFILTSVEP
ncbi:MAG: hypothetical protein SNJ82_11855 [Gemmataceae bacterium]